MNKHDNINNMHSWYQKLLKSRIFLSEQCEQEAKKTKNSESTLPSSTLLSCSSSPSLPGTTPSKALQSQSTLQSLLRWSRKYDVFLCHSSVDSDSEEARCLVSFLEASPCSLRCFLQQRDECPGAAISTELCLAVQNSHVWALLITSNFLQDEWCKYIMHQALAEGAMSNRIIPLVLNLSHSQYPQELKFYFYIDLSHNPEQGYTLLKKTVLEYLKNLVKKEKAVECNMVDFNNGSS